MIAAAEVGYRTYAKVIGAADPEGGPDTVMSATLALSGLLLAFSFGTAQGHYDERRQLVVAESSPIGPPLLRQQLLAGPDRAQLQPLMRAYVRARRTAVAADPGDRGLVEAQ